jgi:hypothetical protein
LHGLAGAEQNCKPEEGEFFHEADPCHWRPKKTGANDNLTDFSSNIARHLVTWWATKLSITYLAFSDSGDHYYLRLHAVAIEHHLGIFHGQFLHCIDADLQGGAGPLPSSCTAWCSVVMNSNLPSTSMCALTEKIGPG